MRVRYIFFNFGTCRAQKWPKNDRGLLTPLILSRGGNCQNCRQLPDWPEQDASNLSLWSHFIKCLTFARGCAFCILPGAPLENFTHGSFLGCIIFVDHTHHISLNNLRFNSFAAECQSSDFHIMEASTDQCNFYFSLKFPGV